LPDSEVEKLLNFFTFLPQSTISKTIQEHMQAPEKRTAQHLLAKEFVELVHGAEDAEAAREKHLSRSKVTRGPSLPAADIKLEASQVVGQPYPFLLHAAGLAESKSKAARLVDSGGAYLIDVAGHAAKIEKGAIVDQTDLITVTGGKTGKDEKFLVLRAGKWRTRTITIE
jgi:tyrosyl-tRNA synthetase